MQNSAELKSELKPELKVVEKSKPTNYLNVESEAQIKKRDNGLVPFDRYRIYRAIEKSFRADIQGAGEQPAERELADELRRITDKVVREALVVADPNAAIDVEHIQDLVERILMESGHYSVARRYIVYRDERARARALRGEELDKKAQPQQIQVLKEDNTYVALDWEEVRSDIINSCQNLAPCSAENLIEEVSRSLYNGIGTAELDKAKILAARSQIEKDPAYSTAAARLLMNVIYKEVFNQRRTPLTYQKVCRDNFESSIKLCVENRLLDESLLSYDFKKLSAALAPERDHLFQYMGLQILFDRYLLHINKRRVETPQYFWMRVAMGLANNEAKDKEQRAIQFYNTLSTFRFISSTPTLFNAGTLHPQLSSCYLSTINDDLDHIFKVVKDNALLSKWAGGIGNDWTNVRASGARIKGTNGESQGVVPFLKVANDTAIAVNQGGKRKGAVCAYLETWHLEIEEFLELRKNTGDDRRRTHDMHTANWIPDLFMKRVQQNGQWTLFSPEEVPDLHHTYGKDFEQRYAAYEEKALRGEMQLFKQMSAVELWRKMLSMLFETGHPWITFKDPSNVRSPQDHVGVVHNSNLCTEILLNTSDSETAVCNLGSINLVAHINENGLDEELLRDTVSTAVHMLDNVIDINYYPTAEARNSNLKHRPVGLGLMGFQDALYKLGISYASKEAVEFSDQAMESISYYAILRSAELAKERGKYQSYEGSKWSRGLLPLDTIDLLAEQRDGYVEVDKSSRKDWSVARKAIKENGMRNSNVMAIAPTATIANIIGVAQSIEPTFRNLFVKSNLSGEFTVINPYLVEDLKKEGLWDEEMIDDLKYFDGSIQTIDRIPQHLKETYRTAIEVDQHWLIDCASRRQKWIDMGQSLNLYIGSTSGKVLNDLYFAAWQKGLKTTYYLRSVGATQIEKSSMDINKRGIQPRWMRSKSASSEVTVERTAEERRALAESADAECEACQ